MNGATFTKVCSNETRIDYRGMKFLLVEQDRGSGGMGRAIQLYALDGFKREHIKEIGWTRDDNAVGMRSSDAYYKEKEILPMQAELFAIEYIDKLI
mgnify:FL=1